MKAFFAIAVFLISTCSFAGKLVDRPDPYASPYAVKGGTIRFNGSRPPKSYNYYVDSNVYTHMTFSLMYETLLSFDGETGELTAGLASEWEVSEDGREFVFTIDEAARWSDGLPITARDVKWTFDTVVDPASDTGPNRLILAAFESPEILGERKIKFRSKAKEKDWRALVHCGCFEIMPAHTFKGMKFDALDLVNATVSGPYRLSQVKEQIEATFTRRDDWWRAKRKSVRGTYNFDKVVIRYFADNENAFEAFKKRLIDVYPVYSAHLMATGTRGKAFDRNWIIVRRVKNSAPIGFQGFAMNTRRFPFDDLKTREAMALLLDRETMNRTMMFSEYFLLDSYMTDIWDAQHPSPNRKWRYDPAAAKKLLEEAGWRRNGATGLLEKDGKAFTFTFLGRGGEDKFLSLYNAALKDAGIEMKSVRKDFASWMRDMDSFSFDMTWAAWGASTIKNPDSMWSEEAADEKGGNNITGIKDKRLSELLKEEKSCFSAARRLELYREMDSLLASKVPYVLLWNINATRILYWNKFGMPDGVLDKFGREEAALAYWWYDEDAARELDEAISSEGFLPSVPVTVVQ